jgi:hypothetical protein
MAAEHDAGRAQPGVPAFFRPDGRSVVEQTVWFLLLAQLRQPGVVGMIGNQERLLPMEDRRDAAGGVVEAVDLAIAESELDATTDRRVRVGLEIGKTML